MNDRQGGKLFWTAVAILLAFLIGALFFMSCFWFDVFDRPEIGHAPVDALRCQPSLIPDSLQVRHHNLYWQLVDAPVNTSANTTLYLYNAYYDNRLAWAPVVKILVSSENHTLVETLSWWCALWFHSSNYSISVNVTDYYTIYSGDPGIYHPALITCPMPSDHAKEIPHSVSLQSRGECGQVAPSNLLQVVNRPREKSTSGAKRSIGVIVQAFRFKTWDISLRLVEWLEMVRLMGADKVYFSVLGAAENVLRVLRHYEQEGLVNWRFTTLPGSQPNLESLYNLWAFHLGDRFWPQERLELNDCFYRHLYQHDYFLVMDVDEMLVPKKVSNWHQLLDSVESSFWYQSGLLNGYIYPRHARVCEVMEEDTIHPNGKSIPSYLYMMRHIFRTRVNDPYTNIKSFQPTSHVTIVSNHNPARCYNTRCHGFELSAEDAILLHFRRNYKSAFKLSLETLQSECPVRDVTLWRFYETIEPRVREKLVSIFREAVLN